MKVSINAGGREVTVETTSDQDVTHDEIASQALRVWKETGSDPEGFEGPAYGFTTETAPDRRPSSAMRRVPEVPE